MKERQPKQECLKGKSYKTWLNNFLLAVLERWIPAFCGVTQGLLFVCFLFFLYFFFVQDIFLRLWSFPFSLILDLSITICKICKWAGNTRWFFAPVCVTSVCVRAGMCNYGWEGKRDKEIRESSWTLVSLAVSEYTRNIAKLSGQPVSAGSLPTLKFLERLKAEK